MKVVHCKREPFDIYIGRPSKWGNPFSHLSGTLAKYRVGSRAEAIQKYRQWIKTQQHLLDALHELRDQRLGCWCKPHECHGDVLIEMVVEKYGTADQPAA